MITFATAQTTDGASSAFYHDGGQAVFQCSGTWEGTEMVALEYSPDGGTTWFQTGVIVTATTAAEGDSADLETPCKLRANIVGAGATTSLTPTLVG